ncbi:cytochrome c3 family protein [Lutibacter sp.]|uniref:cytochrome c3 family protein n=1 Tax=Lutibacter sp. TaxID=1925666 RepID=UPI0025C15D57|nr:cytochrome c3 family protein [Lutibacter sp.]MCF6169192.1 cytochrome c3 family protein [Lutibacter sp.]
MKTTKILLTLGLAGFMSIVSFGQNIAGSAHDFSGDNWNNTGEICVVCHTPHNAATMQEAPLWNHEVTTTVFTLYTNATSPSFDATASQPDGSSKLCLSCHDGTVAMDNFGGRTNGADLLTGNKNLGTDLSNDHPVSFVYDAALATTDGGLFDPTSTNSGLGGTINSDLLLANKLQCSSCHDVHNGSGLNDLLVVSNTASALCLTCHNK